MAKIAPKYLLRLYQIIVYIVCNKYICTIYYSIDAATASQPQLMHRNITAQKNYQVLKSAKLSGTLQRKGREISVLSLPAERLRTEQSINKQPVMDIKPIMGD